MNTSIPPLIPPTITPIETHATDHQVSEAFKYILKNLGPGLTSDDPVVEFQNILDLFYVTKTSTNRNYNSMKRALVVKYTITKNGEKVKTNIPIWIMKSICQNITISEILLSDIFMTVEFKQKMSEFTNNIGSNYMRMIKEVDLMKIKPTDLDLNTVDNLILFEIKRKVSKEEIDNWSSKKSRKNH